MRRNRTHLVTESADMSEWSSNNKRTVPATQPGGLAASSCIPTMSHLTRNGDASLGSTRKTHSHSVQY